MSSGLHIKNLTAGYNGTMVIKDINLQMHPGKVTALIGPSGCGKTTLLRCINRLHELSTGAHVNGEILLDGENILAIDPNLLRRKIGMVFQKPNPFPMSIRENILYGIKAGKIKANHAAVVETSLTRSGIWNEVKDRLSENAFNFSLGQQQRICIARSLAVLPKVILMDEPAASLDPASTARVEESIRAMKDEFTVVIVTHNMQQARRISDYSIFMYLGEVVEAGETSQVFENPSRPETRQYIGGQFG